MHRRQLGFSSPHLSLLILFLELGVSMVAQRYGEMTRWPYLQVTQPFLLLGVEARFLAVVGIISPRHQA